MFGLHMFQVCLGIGSGDADAHAYTERSQDMDIADYIGQLTLSDTEICGAQGRSFDRTAVALRLDNAIGRWVEDRPPPPHRYRSLLRARWPSPRTTTLAL